MSKIIEPKSNSTDSIAFDKMDDIQESASRETQPLTMDANSFAVHPKVDLESFDMDYTNHNETNGKFDGGSAWAKNLPPSWVAYIFPPNTPRSVLLMRKENLAVPACYLCVGLLQGLSGPFLNIYPRFLGATEAQQTTIASIRSLPAVFKLGFGFLSDTVPFMGYRRKSYMFIGWLMSSLSMIALLTTNLNGIVDDDTGDLVPSDNAPTIGFLSVTIFLFGTGFWFADVMGDSIVAEKAKLEPVATRGQLQSTCYACRFFGLMVSAPVSSVIYSTLGPKAIVVMMAVTPLLMLPFIYNFWERKDVEVKSTQEQCGEIWRTVCSRAVWQPMGFVYIYNVLQIGNAAWREYLMSILRFTDNQMNLLFIISLVLLYAGVMAYKFYFINWSWRSVYVTTTMLNTVFSSLQVLLIYGITFGLSPFLFALGDEFFADFISGIQFLPTTIMMVHLCPSGSEGASYAMFTTANNAALGLASTLSTVVLRIWDVSKETMLSGDLSGLVKLTILTTILQTSGILFVKMLPNTREDLTKLHKDPLSGSKVGGFIFLAITFSSIMSSVVVGLLNIFAPGWAGESR